MTPEVMLNVAGLVGTGVVSLLVWSLKRNVTGVDSKLDRIERDVRQLSAQVGSHDASLAAGVVKFSALEKRIDGLEERERDRGCFSNCRATRAAAADIGGGG